MGKCGDQGWVVESQPGGHYNCYDTESRLAGARAGPGDRPTSLDELPAGGRYSTAHPDFRSACRFALEPSRECPENLCMRNLVLPALFCFTLSLSCATLGHAQSLGNAG